MRRIIAVDGDAALTSLSCARPNNTTASVRNTKPPTLENPRPLRKCCLAHVLTSLCQGMRSVDANLDYADCRRVTRNSGQGAAVPVLLFSVALLACWLRARREGEIDPMEAL